MQKIITWFYRAWLRIVYLVRSLFAKKGHKIYERIPVTMATEKDLLRLGRKIDDKVSYSKDDVRPHLVSFEKDLLRLGRKLDDKVSNSKDNVRPHLVSFEKEDKPQITSRTMQVIKHKKTGRVVVCPGNLEQIKSMYNSDWEIVESEIK